MVVVTVPGMACRHDVRTISAHVADLEGIAALRVDLASKTVTVDGDLSVEAVAAAIAAAGYTISDPSTVPASWPPGRCVPGRPPS